MQSKPMLTAPDLAQGLPEVSDVLCPVWPVWRWWCRHLWPGSAAQDATCVVGPSSARHGSRCVPVPGPVLPSPACSDHTHTTLYTCSEEQTSSDFWSQVDPC